MTNRSQPTASGTVAPIGQHPRSMLRLKFLLVLLAPLLLTALSSRGAVQATWQQVGDVDAPAMVHHDMVYDSARHVLIVAGRSAFVAGSPVDVALGQADGTWMTLPSPTPPPGGHDVELAYDADREVTVLYTDDTNRVWELSGTTWRMIEAPTAPVQCYDGALLQYDPVRKKTVLVGCDGWPDQAPEPSETWLWDGTNWTPAAGPEQSPPDAAGGGLAFDAARGELVLLTKDTAQTWTFDGATWTQRTPATVPSPGVWVFDLAYHPPTQRVVFFGGEHVDPTNPFDSTHPTNTWAWDGTDWQLLDPPSTPPDTIDYGFAWFPERSAMVMHGGWGPTGEWARRSTVWLLSLTSEPVTTIRFLDLQFAPPGQVWLRSVGRGSAGVRQVLQSADALATNTLWFNLQTNAVPDETNDWVVPATWPRQFFRVEERP